MQQLNMTEDQFWTIVDQVDWRTLVEENSDSPYKPGKERLLSLLPTYKACKDFSHHFQMWRGQLSMALDEYEQETGERVPVSDDGWSDLSSMVIGLGREVFEKNLKDPSLLMKRANAGWSGVNGYVESFAYCIPGKEDYDPIWIKLAREVDGLNYWLQQAEERGGLESCDRYIKRDVEERTKRVTALREEMKRLGHEEWTQERYEQYCKAQEEKRRREWEEERERCRQARESKDAAKKAFLAKYGSWD